MNPNKVNMRRNKSWMREIMEEIMEGGVLSRGGVAREIKPLKPR